MSPSMTKRRMSLATKRSMASPTIVCLFFVLLEMLSTAGAEVTTEDSTSHPQCGVYMAKASSVWSPLSVSFYAGQDYIKGMSIPVFDLGIPLVDIKEQNSLMHEAIVHRAVLGMLWTTEELAGGQFEDRNLDSGLALVSGMGFSGAENPGLANVKFDHHSMLNRYRSGGMIGPNGEGNLDDREDAMAPAVSNYFGMKMVALEDIPAGMEFFPNPGDEFFEFREHEAEDEENDDGTISRSKYIRADSVLQQFNTAVQNHPDFFTETTKIQEYWDLIRLELVEDEKVQMLLPENAAEVAEFVAQGALHKNNPDIQRSLEYLQNEGTCADTIVVKPSTIKGAGRGAFAKRAIKEGDIAAPYPLMRLPEEMLLMYDLDEVQRIRRKQALKKRKLVKKMTEENAAGGLQRKRKVVESDEEEDFEVEAAQLLMNYVLGHPDTSMVWYPFGPGVNFINHAPYNHKSAKTNVEMVWSKKAYHEERRFLNMGMNTMVARGTNPFVSVMDLVATRDIAEGEELFMNYGHSFNRELIDHFDAFRSGEDDPPRSNVLNTIMAQMGDPFRTIDEQEKNPYPHFVSPICYVDVEQAHVIQPDAIPKSHKMTIPADMQFDKHNALKLYGVISNFTMDATVHQCQILHRQGMGGDGDSDSSTSNYLYLVQLLIGSGLDEAPYFVDVPHSSILLTDEPYTSSMHTLNTLRHNIEIPDNIFPDAWRDMVEG
jgi:hypothetical protein